MTGARWHRPVCAIVVSVASLLWASDAAAARGQRVDVPVRGKMLHLTVYRPDVPQSRWKGTVVMGSGDVGWVGLAVSTAEFLSDAGYVVAGVNVRQYLSTFATGRSHLTTDDVPIDFAAMAATLRQQGLLAEPVVLAGVSEGAALAVLGASSPANHAWARGVITMGLPATAALAWRWTDFTTWITKKDADEPSFSPGDFIGQVSPLSLHMIQSTRDEYVPESDYRALEQAARQPKSLTLIAASNHRFTDRVTEVRRAVIEALETIRSNVVGKGERVQP
jgi:hypothetical protein